MTGDFRDTLQSVVAENESRAGRSLATWLPGFHAWRRTALLTAAALAVAGFAIVFFGQRRRLEQDLERTRTASAGWELRYRNEQRARELAESERRDALAQAAAPLFTLNLTRGADLSTAEPTNTVTISPSAKSVVLSLEWQNDPEFQSYRASLADANGRVVWSADPIAPPSSGALAITLPASLFKPGQYLLRAEGTKAGRSSVVGRYTFSGGFRPIKFSKNFPSRWDRWRSCTTSHAGGYPNETLGSGGSQGRPLQAEFRFELACSL